MIVALCRELALTKARLADLTALAREAVRDIDLEGDGSALEMLIDMVGADMDAAWAAERAKHGTRAPPPRELIDRAAAAFEAAGLVAERGAWTVIGRATPEVAVVVDCYSDRCDAEGFGPCWAMLVGPPGTLVDVDWVTDGGDTLDENLRGAIAAVVERMATDQPATVSRDSREEW